MNEMDVLVSQLQSSFVRIEQTRPALLGQDRNIPLDDTTGWADLEINLSKLQDLILLSDPQQFSQLFDEDIFDLIITKASIHINRHVRQSTHEFMKNLVLKVLMPLNINSLLDETSKSVKSVYDKMCEALCIGLQDDWSEIKLVSCHAARAFLLSLSETDQQLFWSNLLPRLCLNRFYTAEGVQSYSHETWKLVIKSRGKSLLIQYMEQTVEHYILMSQAKNHMVSEAACHAMAELVNKIDRYAVIPFIPPLLVALHGCLQEPSWPVRDAAVVASGSFLKHYPVESQSLAADFMRIWSKQLKDSIWSVRENACFAFGEALLTNDVNMQQKTCDFIGAYLNIHLDKAKESVEESKKAKFTSFLPPELLVPKRTMAVNTTSQQPLLSPASSPSNITVGVDNTISSNVIETELQSVPLQTLSIQPASSSSSSAPSSSSSTKSNSNNNTTTSTATNTAAITSWRAGGGWGCCLDCIIERKHTLWETSAGCVVLIREVLRAGCEVKSTEMKLAMTPRQQKQQSHQPQQSGMLPVLDTYNTTYSSLTQLITMIKSNYLSKIWDLLILNHFKESDKLHTLVLEQLPDIYEKLSKLSISVLSPLPSPTALPMITIPTTLSTTTRTKESSPSSCSCQINEKQTGILKSIITTPITVDTTNAFQSKKFAAEAFVEALLLSHGPLRRCCTPTGLAVLLNN